MLKGKQLCITIQLIIVVELFPQNLQRVQWNCYILMTVELKRLCVESAMYCELMANQYIYVND